MQTRNKSPDEVADHFGWFTMFAGVDVPASSEKTRRELGWHPDHPGLLADLDDPRYFGGVTFLSATTHSIHPVITRLARVIHFPFFRREQLDRPDEPGDDGRRRLEGV